MPTPATALKILVVGLLLFGANSTYIDKAAAQEAEASPQPDEGLWVEVEPTNLLPSDITGVYYLVPYRNRREKWGHNLNIGYSSYHPVNYEPAYLQANYDDVYPSAKFPLVEITYTFKRNLGFGTVGVDVGAGMYKATAAQDSGITSDLELIPVRLGMSFALDTIYFEPYVVPYVGGGAYTVFYKEKMTAENSHGGNTLVAPYYSLGVAFQLNWVDRESARVSYLDSGIENTFLYLEARKFMASQAANDPDFSTGFDWGAGVRLEF